jgi:hypothetical protein
MRKLDIQERPMILCPITKEWRIPTMCMECEAYGGMYDEAPAPIAVLCKTDQIT